MSRIDSVATHMVSVPRPQPVWTAHEEMKAWNVILTEVSTNDGLVGYGEIANDIWSQSNGFAPLGQAYQESFADDNRVVLVKINTKEDVWPALKRFFSKHPEVQTIQ